MAAKQKPRYDGTWRPEPGKTLPPVPDGVQPVIRFRNPLGGSVVWDDKVKGRIEISNDELDDLVIARPAGDGTAGHADLQLLRRRRRHRHGDHARDPRRRPCQQHAAPDQHPARARRRAAGVCAPADRAQRAGREDEQAPRRQAGDAVPRRRLPGRCGGQLPGAPRLEPRRRRDLLARAVACSGSTSTTSGSSAGAVRRGQAALGQFAAPEGHAPTTPLAPLVVEQLQRRGMASTRQAPWLEPAIAPVQGPLRHHGRAGRLAAMLVAPVQPVAPRTWPQHVDRRACARRSATLADRLLEAARGTRPASPLRSSRCCASTA